MPGGELQLCEGLDLHYATVPGREEVQGAGEEMRRLAAAWLIWKQKSIQLVTFYRSIDQQAEAVYIQCHLL